MATDTTDWTDADLAYWHETPPPPAPRRLRIPTPPPMSSLVDPAPLQRSTPSRRTGPAPSRTAARRARRRPRPSSPRPPPRRPGPPPTRHPTPAAPLPLRHHPPPLHHYPHFLARQAWPPLSAPPPPPPLQNSTTANNTQQPPTPNFRSDYKATYDLFTALVLLDQSLRAVDCAYGALVHHFTSRGCTNFHFPQVADLISSSLSLQSAVGSFSARFNSTGPLALLPQPRPSR